MTGFCSDVFGADSGVVTRGAFTLRAALVFEIASWEGLLSDLAARLWFVVVDCVFSVTALFFCGFRCCTFRRFHLVPVSIFQFDQAAQIATPSTSERASKHALIRLKQIRFQFRGEISFHSSRFSGRCAFLIPNQLTELSGNTYRKPANMSSVTMFFLHSLRFAACSLGWPRMEILGPTCFSQLLDFDCLHSTL